MRLEGAQVLVTGATGLIGGALVAQLSSLGTTVWALARSSSPELDRLRAVAKVIEAPSYAPSAVRSALDGLSVDVVFHLGAYGVRPSERDPALLESGNAGVTEAVLSAVARPRRVIFAGSSAEYAAGVEAQPIDESHPLLPASPYGAAKLAAYRAGTALAKQLGIDFVTLRPFGVYGPGEAPQRLVPYVARCLARGETPNLSAGEQARDWIYVDDVADAFVCAARAELAPGEAYNVCTGQAVRVRDVVKMVAKALDIGDTDLGLGRLPYRPDEPMWVVGNPTRFRAATGWRPRVELEEGIRRTVAWAVEVTP